MVPHAMPKQEKAWFCSPSQSAGERAPESVATPATEVRAPEPTPVAPHERERRSTPPIPAPRVSWRLLLLTSSDTDTYIASESATAIFRFVFFLPACAVRFRKCDLSTSKGKIGIRFEAACILDRVDRDAPILKVSLQTRSEGALRECLRVACHTRARARERSRRPTEHLRNRRFVCQTLAGTYGRAFSGPRRPRVDARAYHRRDSRSRATTIRGDALSSNRRSEARSGDDGLRRGRFETKGASAHRSRQDINAHIAPARSEARRLERHPSSSGAPVIVAFVVERTQPYSRRVRASSRSSKSKSISPGAPRSRRANRGGRDARTRRHDSHVLSPLRRARARVERSQGPTRRLTRLSRPTRRMRATNATRNVKRKTTGG